MTNDLMQAGATLATIAFNLGQREGHPIKQEWAESLRDACRAWDKAKNAEQQRHAEDAEIVAVYDKLEAGRVVGMHPLHVAEHQIAAGASMEHALRDIGFVPAPKWLPIESAPKDGTAMLGYRKPRMHAAIVGTAYVVPRDDGECWYFAGTCAHVDIAPEVKPTHWMPLPAAPQASEENDGAASLNSGAVDKD